jgi:hypothetical protein
MNPKPRGVHNFGRVYIMSNTCLNGELFSESKMGIIANFGKIVGCYRFL